MALLIIRLYDTTKDINHMVDNLNILERRIHALLTTENYENIAELIDLRFQHMHALVTHTKTTAPDDACVSLLHQMTRSNKNIIQILQQHMAITKAALINVTQLKKYSN